MTFEEFLSTSYSAYQAVENAKNMLTENGFTLLSEQELWNLCEGGKYFVVRNGAIIAFRYKKGAFKIIASHTDSPCLKLKENAAASDGNYTRLNTEPYGGGLWYSFFDRPLRLAGRLIKEKNEKLISENFVSDFRVVLPSLAIHMNREANEKFAPNLQTELPLLSLGKCEFEKLLGGAISYDLYAVPDETPFVSGANEEFFSAPRIDNLSSVYASLVALIQTQGHEGTVLAACLESEEIGSRTRGGAGSDFLRSTLERIANYTSDEARLCTYANSFLVSLDNAHALHPNHPEKCDPTNRAQMGKGVVIKGHAGGAYTTDGLTSAVIKKIFRQNGVAYQTFYNRSDMRSGSTLGAISLAQATIPSVDLGLAQLAMHSAIETMAISDFENLMKGLTAFYASKISFCGENAIVE